MRKDTEKKWSWLDLPEDFSLLIQEHLNQVTAAVKAFGAEENNQVFAMDSNELKRLDQILTIINHSVSQINKLHTEGRFSGIAIGWFSTEDTVFRTDSGSAGRKISNGG